MYDPISIANYFIKKSWERGTELTPMKLVKLVYIAHGWHLGITQQPLLTEVPQAWQYGPVVPMVYHSFKRYGNKQVTQLYSTITTDGPVSPIVNDASINLLLDKVWDIYSRYNGVQLSALTHQPNTPWDIVWNQQGGKHKQGAIIPNNIIAAHYKTVIDGLKSTQPVAIL
jgi:uncharacterized phage-associated protein